MALKIAFRRLLFGKRCPKRSIQVNYLILVKFQGFTSAKYGINRQRSFQRTQKEGQNAAKTRSWIAKKERKKILIFSKILWRTQFFFFFEFLKIFVWFFFFCYKIFFFIIFFLLFVQMKKTDFDPLNIRLTQREAE